MPLEKRNKFERRKQKSEYSVLQKACGNQKDFDLLQEEYSPEELSAFEEQMKSKWDANFLPKLLDDAIKRRQNRTQKMAA